MAKTIIRTQANRCQLVRRCAADATVDELVLFKIIIDDELARRSKYFREAIDESLGKKEKEEQP